MMQIVKRKWTYTSNLGDTFVDDLDRSLQFLTVESLEGLGQILLLRERQHVVLIWADVREQS